MKITDPEIIRSGEKDLIDAVKEDLDWDALKEILKDKISKAALESRDGQIVVHNNQVAFKINFDLKLSGSLMFDREGNYLEEEDDLTHAPLTGESVPDHSPDRSGDEPDDVPDLSPDFSENDIDDILKESRDFWDQKGETESD